MDHKRICIIGAGISGLVTAKTFLQQGHSVTVFESSPGLGGVWERSRHYPGLSTQSPRDQYAYSDFDMPGSYPEFLSAAQMLQYLESYADHFDLLKHICLQTRVSSVRRSSDLESGWKVSWVGTDRASGQETMSESVFDFVVVCNGVFSQPSLPAIPGRDIFEAHGGQVLHSSEFSDQYELDNARVVIVGFGKSALDIAGYAVDRARSCSLICRRVLWKIPRFLAGLIPVKYLILNRYAEMWFPSDDAGRTRRILHGPLRFLVALHWKNAEWLVGRQLGLRKRGIRPAWKLQDSVGSCFGLAPEDNFKAIRKGRIGFHKAGLKCMTQEGIELDNGDRVVADIIIFATGFEQEAPFLDEKTSGHIFDQDKVPHLYRFLVSPDIPDIGFVGYNVGAATQLNAEVGALWLHEWMIGRLQLPKEQKMRAEIKKQLDWRRNNLSAKRGMGYDVTPRSFEYLDSLLADLGLQPADRHRNPLRRAFKPIHPPDYQGLAEATKQAQRPVDAED